MGQGGIGGNGSVYWEFVHHNVAGGQKPITPGTVGGDDQVGFNAGRSIGKDSLPFNDIGKRPNASGLQEKKFKLTLRYPTPAAASAALAAASALIAGSTSTGAVDVVIYVDAIDRPNRPPLPQMEIQVEW